MKKIGIASIFCGVVALVLVLLIVANNSRKNDTVSAPENNSTNVATQTQDSDTANQNQIAIENYAYSPKKITIKKGTQVTWTNKDNAKHDITPDNQTDEFKASRLLGKGESYSVTFNTVGTYTYYCSPHTYMKAEVVVIE